jgi:hypothetical protein
MQQVLRAECEASQKQMERMQRILNVLDSLQHLLYSPFAVCRPVNRSGSRETLMKLFRKESAEESLRRLQGGAPRAIRGLE